MRTQIEDLSVTTEGITEDDIANYLVNTPGFFDRNAELLASIQLTSPHGQRAVSLQERQMEMLRDKAKALEGRIVDMLRHGQDNEVIADKLHRWTKSLLMVNRARDMPGVLVTELEREFGVPQAGIRAWGVMPEFAEQPFALGVSDDAKTFASSLTLPYCGVNSGFEAASWLGDPSTVMSMALIPLREEGALPAFGMLVLASPDPSRYSADMGTEFLARIGEMASACLSRLLPPAPVRAD
jgi:hypothetical protein